MAEHVEHADNGPSNTGRAARSASFRRRVSTPPGGTEAPLSADTQASEPGGALTLDLFDEGPERALESDADNAAQAVSAKESHATPARRAARTKAASETAEDAASAGGDLNDVDDRAAVRTHSEAPQALAATEIDALPQDQPGGEAASTQASGAADPAPGEPDLRDVPDKAGQREQPAATVAGESPQTEAPDAQEPAPPSPEPWHGLQGAAAEPAVMPLPASGTSYAAMSATGNTARMNSVVHAADIDAAVHDFVPERAASLSGEHAAAGLPAEIVAAMAAQTRRTKWMLTAAVAALVVTAGVAIAQTLLLASLSADSEAQQQRFDVLMQNQQAALENVAARLAATAVAAPVAAEMAPATAATSAAREQPSATPPRHRARAAKAAKSSEKSTSHAEGAKSSKARSQHTTQHSTRQAAAKS